MSIRVLLADDQAMVRAGFRMILESDPEIEVVGEAANGEQATASTRRLRPDIVLMDIQMPDGDGLEATGGLPKTASCTVARRSSPRSSVTSTCSRRCGRAPAASARRTPHPRNSARGARRDCRRGSARPVGHAAHHRAVRDAGRSGWSWRAAGRLVDSASARRRGCCSGESNVERPLSCASARARSRPDVCSLLAKLGLRDRVQAACCVRERAGHARRVDAPLSF